MNDVKTWADIDASPLLQLPPEQRKKLHDANDERFRTFWAECFLTAQTPGRGEDAWNSVDFCKAFLDAFDFGKQSRGRPSVCICAPPSVMHRHTTSSRKKWL